VFERPLPDRYDFEELKALRAAVVRGASQSEVAPLLDSLRTELEYRAYGWIYMQKHAAVGESIPFGNERTERVPSLFSLGRYYLAVAGAIGAIVVAFLYGLSWGAGLATVSAVGLVAWQLQANRGRRLKLNSGKCIKCGYDLSSLPRAIDPAAIQGIDVGPEKCPECGRAWPRIPKRDGSA
jgi:hypothetical protein